MGNQWQLILQKKSWFLRATSDKSQEIEKLKKWTSFKLSPVKQISFYNPTVNPPPALSTEGSTEAI